MRKYLKTICIGVVIGVICVSGLVLAPPARAQMPDDDKITFRILRDGQPFGMHKLAFSENQQGQTVVDITIDMSFSIGPVTLFRYHHENQEIWDGDKIISMTSETNDDGKLYDVSAIWDKDKLSVDAKKVKKGTETNDDYDAAPDIYTTSYWNSVTLKGTQILNTQKGKIEDISVTDKGIEDIETASGMIPARRYDIEARVPITIWYDTANNKWAGLKFNVRNSEITYKRLD